MHELALANSIVAIVQDEAARGRFTRVRTLRLDMGALGHVEEAALLFCLAAAMRGTPAEGATVDVVRLPGRAWCLDCNKSVSVSSRLDSCPECSGERLQVTGGDELRVRELEVE